jgi:hypothetical protein
MTITVAEPGAPLPNTATLEHWLDQGLYLRVHPHVDRLVASERAVHRL